MSYLDFIKHFSKLEICNLSPDTLQSDEVGHWNYYQFEGMWRIGSTAGGCRNHLGWTDLWKKFLQFRAQRPALVFLCKYFSFWFLPATFCTNPQYVVRLEDVDDDPVDGEDGCTFLVGLMQKDGRTKRRLNRDMETIGFAIYKV